MGDTKTVTLEFPEMQPQQRLQELILYIAERLQGDELFGRVKLAKILYVADHESYLQYGKPITGAAYIKMQHGPVPEDFHAILEELESNRQIVTRETIYFGHLQKRIIPMREANLTIFSGRDIQMVEKILRQIEGKTASELSELSHGLAWQIIAPNAQIPYEAALLSDEPLTDDEIAHALALAQEYGIE